MRTVGIVCEYNPLHLGHRKQISAVRQQLGPDTAVVCLMSGNFVQRGAPAIVDKSIRAEAAVLSGADLVLELPVTGCLNSAEGFALEGVRLLSGCCDSLCFGTETGDRDSLLETARTLLSPEFPEQLKLELAKGLSFPAARQAALGRMCSQGELLRLPNDILGVEYCKAVLSLGSHMEIFPIRRAGSYHDTAADPENPSATALRQRMCSGEDWIRFTPEPARELLRSAPLHTLEAGERAVLYRLRTMTDGEFEALPFGSEGLWRKLMHESRRQTALEEIFTAVKSKRYTRTRLQRMVMCAFLGLSRDLMNTPAPWARVLAFNDRGRITLARHRESGLFPNAGQPLEGPWQALEDRADALHPLFRQDAPGSPAEGTRRVRYVR